MALSDLFKSFSSRNPAPAQPVKRLTREFRTRVLMLCRDSFEYSDFWNEIHTKLSYKLGTPRLSSGNTSKKGEDVLLFLESCDDKHFLDFIEFIFATEAVFRLNKDALVEAINTFLKLDHLPYALLPEVWRDASDESRYVSRVRVSLPQVIRKDSQVLHQNAMEPALELLQRPEFAHANTEYMQAHQHFKRGEYGDCLTKCGSAFESVLIVVCRTKKWDFKESDGAATLLRRIMEATDMERFFEKPLIQISVLRNELSTAHGAGDKPRTVSTAKAQYSLNLTAAAIVFLTAEAGM
jgi:hypothetical protein